VRRLHDERPSMANKGFNGSTLVFASATVGSIRSITYGNKAAEVDVTGSGDSVKSYVSGIPDPDVSVEIVGGNALAIGATGALTITWFDASTDGVTSAIVTEASTKGNMDGEITSSYKFRSTV